MFPLRGDVRSWLTALLIWWSSCCIPPRLAEKSRNRGRKHNELSFKTHQAFHNRVTASGQQHTCFTLSSCYTGYFIPSTYHEVFQTSGFYQSLFWFSIFCNKTICHFPLSALFADPISYFGLLASIREDCLLINAVTRARLCEGLSLISRAHRRIPREAHLALTLNSDTRLCCSLW